jgi:hypothetical protein
MGNPLLNLAAALGQTPTTASVGGTFAVKKRWDDGTPPLINALLCRLRAFTPKIWSSRIRLKQHPSDLHTSSMISSGQSSTSPSDYQFGDLRLIDLDSVGNLWPSSSSRPLHPTLIAICYSDEHAFIALSFPSLSIPCLGLLISPLSSRSRCLPCE